MARRAGRSRASCARRRCRHGHAVCADAADASALVLGSAAPVRAFYDLDTPVTLSRLDAGAAVDYLPPHGLGGFDLVLSYTGGGALAALRDRLGARFVRPLYGSVDPEVHRPTAARPAFDADLSYLGTYAADRQAPLEALFLEPARQREDLRFVIGGSMYPASFTWRPNIYYVSHVPPQDHPAFFSSSRLTLNVTRAAMAAMGHCPSGRLFEAAACGVPILTDTWEGLDAFFEPGREIFVADDTEHALAALACDDQARRRVAVAARERTLAATRRNGACSTWSARSRRRVPLASSALEREGINHVGHHPRRGARQSHPAAGILEGAAAHRQPVR